jgi:hypothetical protein
VPDCPEGHLGKGVPAAKGKFKNRGRKDVKTEPSISAFVVEDQSESNSHYYSRPKSVPTIEIAATEAY